VHQLAALCSTDAALRREAVRRGEAIIAAAGPRDEAIHVFTRVLRALRAFSGVADPFRGRKQQEVALAQEALAGLGPLPDDLPGLLQLAVTGNAIDFFRPLRAAREDLRRLHKAGVDHTERLAAQLQGATGPVVYLADNAGEAVFDWPLLVWLAARVELTLVVKGAPSQNDLTREELPALTPPPYPFTVRDNGTDAVGTQLGEVSPALAHLLRTATLVIAKGMANFESLRGVRGLAPVAFCFLAKCAPNARAAGVAPGERVVLLQEPTAA
jgi:uncharacterized protein with ATP-grasp and redox domains